jgi:hypothetical protein
MTLFSAKRTFLIASLCATTVLSYPAYAIFAKLTTNLTGTAINGAVPNGKASINQGNYPVVPGMLAVNVSKLNLADGTVLSVNLSDCPWFGPVAYINVVDGSASINTKLPASCQIGRGSAITMTDPTGVTILSGGSPWKI